MNKRILKLFAEAGFHQPAMEREEGLEAKFDKFAELIEKKAIEDCRDMFMVESVSWNLLNEKLELYGVE
jgi:hypothetical protein